MNSKCCLVCMRPSPDGADVFSEFGKSKNMVEILSKHFWFKVIEPNNFSQLVCPECWTKTHTFHEFYLMVEKANRECFRTDLAITYYLPISGGDKEIRAKQSQVHSERIEEDTVEIDEVKIFIDYPSNLSPNEENRIISTEITKAQFDPNKEFKREIRDNDSDVDDAVDSETSKKPATKPADLLLPAYFDMTCDRCDATFVSFTDAVHHYKDVHNFIYGYIKCCGNHFGSKTKIHDHIKWHINPNCYTCEICNKSFKTSRDLGSHKNFVHMPEECKKFQCENCLKKFSKQHYLNTHTRYANCVGNEENVCPFCKLKLKSKLTLRLHIARMHQQDQNKKFMCEVCAKVYYSKYAIKKHLESHHNTMNKPPVSCKLCGNMFKNECTLKVHIRHTHNPKPLKCPHCVKISPNRKALSSHIKAVHAKKKHHCTMCDKSFTRPIPLKEHMATHTGENLYTCSYCPKTFKSGPNVFKHLRIYHSDEWSSSRKQKQ